ncbi:MAG: dihydropteroate synthase [Bacteroidetes bacterium]|nr:dihydropteroate synthase [Bacteroidota bacterium]
MERKIGSHIFDTPVVMGIVNMTPDSFYAPSRCQNLIEVFKRVELMLKEGAGIIDLGAASSRPGALLPTAAEEWKRLVPLLPQLRTLFPDTLFSLDTLHATIVERAFDLIGPFFINDISAGADDPRMFGVAARLQLPLIAMHKRGITSSDIVTEVRTFFASILRHACEAGLPQIILDPGFGFAKTTGQNYRLLTELSAVFDFTNVLRIVGISRKSMIYKPLRITPEEALSATSALHLFALQQGIDILRVHDVAPAVQVIRLHKLLTSNGAL